MIRMKLKSMLLGLILLGLPSLLSAQLILFKGEVKDMGTGKAIPGVEVSCELDRTTTNEEGKFSFNLPSDVETLTFTFKMEGYESQTKLINVSSEDVNDLGVISLKVSLDDQDEIIPMVLISDSDLDDANSNQSVSSLVGSSNDVFVRTAAYTFSSARFRIRGLDGINTSMFFNGVPMNDLENGRVYWSTWGGLNDVMRSRETSVGLEAIDYTIGGVGGASSIDTRASKQRKQNKVVYSSSNRSYRNRLMVTWGSGQLKNGWSVALSGSRRWSDQGYVEGTYYDAWSYFLSVDKKIGKHTLNLTSLAAPVRRGKGGAAITELYELTDNNYYNPYWGFQNGKVRNSREFRSFQPVNILRHDWDISETSKLTTAASYQFGKSGSTAIDWYGARDPRPDYYRYLPSAIENPNMAALVAEAYRTDPSVSQINFDYMYDVNQNSFEVISDANGIAGNDFSGARSKYIIEERRYDSQKINFNTLYRNYLTDNITLRGGLMYQMYIGNNFKVIDDLLGGEFYVDINRFAEIDFPNNPDARQNDLDNPNRILTEGDVFGYDYDPNVRKATAWGQAEFTFKKVDFFVGGEFSNTQLWREGDVRNGLFPDNSFGKSEVKSFDNYMAKAGLTYKFNTRYYLYANVAMGTRAPFIRNAFVSPRTRNTYVDGLQSEEIMSGEAGYVVRTPRLKARASVYYVDFKNRVKTMSFFNDEEISQGSELDDSTIRLGFVNLTLSGIDQQHVGTELAFEYKITSALEIVGVAAIGQYNYSSNATATIVNDANPFVGVSDRLIYMNNHYLPGMVQEAYSGGLRYNSARYWFANVSVNYFGKAYLDFNPNRRTDVAVSGVREGSDAWNDILAQATGGEGMTVDFFGGKSFKFGDYFISLTVGVNNILDNTELVTGGYEQLRFDFETKDINRFPERRYFMYGRNYFVNLGVSF